MWLISLVAVVICAYFLASMVTDLIKLKFEGSFSPAVSKGNAPSQVRVDGQSKIDTEKYQVINSRNIFDSKAVPGVTPEPVVSDSVEEEVPVGGVAVLTTLGIKLISTFAVGDGTDKRSSCVISGGGGKQDDVYTVSDTKQFAPDTKITKILFDRVEFINKKRLEYAMIEDFAKGVNLNVPPRADDTPPTEEPKLDVKVEKNDEGKYTIDRAEIDSAIANLDKLYTQVRAVPHFKDGNPNGLKLLSVRSGSLFSKLGLQRGDILQKINGMDLDIKKGLEIFNQLKSENNIIMVIERKGAPQTLEYEIK